MRLPYVQAKNNHKENDQKEYDMESLQNTLQVFYVRQKRRVQAYGISIRLASCKITGQKVRERQNG